MLIYYTLSNKKESTKSNYLTIRFQEFANNGTLVISLPKSKCTGTSSISIQTKISTQIKCETKPVN